MNKRRLEVTGMPLHERLGEFHFDDAPRNEQHYVWMRRIVSEGMAGMVRFRQATDAGNDERLHFAEIELRDETHRQVAEIPGTTEMLTALIADDAALAHLVRTAEYGPVERLTDAA